ncbi:DMT family transporter [Oceanibaculum nanhaiense]|uniref:DMT family transporter n=1 Tax=Oceanibaculum nanhaiense TaxID=1909734 RepID=UPI000A377705|nr:DMT family transporter [Oceanibaculum nanhaiense]MBC7135383.1 DMT family transporter [Oceanibaculum nanhaiense]
MDAIKSQWADLPPNVRGILWVVLSGLLFASFMAIVRHVGTTMNPIQMSFIRYAFGMLFMLPFFMRMQLSDFRAANIKLHATRGILHGLAVMMWFYAMSRIPIAEVTALGFTSPIFATIAAVLLLGERIRLRRMVAVLGGLLGALIILRPGAAIIDPGAMAMLVAAPIFAFSDVMAKLLMRKESGPAVVGYLSIFVTLVTMVPALYVWRAPTPEEWALMALTAFIATLGHLAMVQGFKLAEVSVTQPAKFLQLIWATLIGFLLFGEFPTVWTWIGAAIVVAAVSYIAHREAVARRHDQRHDQPHE